MDIKKRQNTISIMQIELCNRLGVELEYEVILIHTMILQVFMHSEERKIKHMRI